MNNIAKIKKIMILISRIVRAIPNARIDTRGDFMIKKIIIIKNAGRQIK